MQSCVFCRICEKQLPSAIVYEDDRVVAFKDINPQAPVHLLVVPRKHIPRVTDLEEADADLMLHVFHVVRQLAQDSNISGNGFRIVMNCGDDGGQTVAHLHVHLLGGRQMRWPPG